MALDLAKIMKARDAISMPIAEMLRAATEIEKEDIDSALLMCRMTKNIGEEVSEAEIKELMNWTGEIMTGVIILWTVLSGLADVEWKNGDIQVSLSERAAQSPDFNKFMEHDRGREGA